MASFFIPVEHYQTKFYQREVLFKNFQEIDESSLAEIAKKVYKMQERFGSNTSHSLYGQSKLDLYQETIKYLTNPLVHQEIKSFDERVIFLIMMMDPDLVIFKEYLKANLTSLDQISKVEDIEERVKLKQQRDKEITKYTTTVREKIGFYDSNLLKYEELLFKKFYNNELITEVGLNNQDSFLNLAKFIKNFDSISDERFEELQEIAQGWLSLVQQKNKSKVATYSVSAQKHLLGIKGITEQLAMFILLVDPNLDMLRIYEEESFIPKVKERILEEFDYYNPDLLTLESKFHKRFCPEKEISPWTKTK